MFTLKSTWLYRVDYSLEKNWLLTKTLAKIADLPSLNLGDVKAIAINHFNMMHFTTNERYVDCNTNK